jgi:hypothetical protein
MKLLRTTALTAALMAIALPSLTSPAHAWRVGGWRGAGLGWRGGGLGWCGGGWGWRAAGLGLAAAAVGTAAAASSYYGYGCGYPATAPAASPRWLRSAAQANNPASPPRSL